MRNHLRFGLLILAGIASACSGCMHTRYAETTRNWDLGGSSGGCSCGSAHHATHQERHWSGFWLGQPDQVRP